MASFMKPNGMGGNPYNAGTDTTGVKSVIVRAGKYVDAVKFVFKSGKETPSFGGGGGESNTFTVDVDDHIVQINVWQGWGTDALQFITKNGKDSGKIGGAGGGLKVYKAPCGEALVGFHGRSGALVDKFVPVFGLIAVTSGDLTPHKTTEKITDAIPSLSIKYKKNFEEGRSSIAASLSQMEQGNWEEQNETFEAHWEEMATSFEGQIATLQLVAKDAEEAEKSAEHQMIQSEGRRAEAAKKVKEHQESVANCSSEVERVTEEIRQCEEDIHREEAMVENKKRELQKKQKERDDAALAIIPGVGLFNAIFNGGKAENIIPGVGAIKAAISLIEQDVERAHQRLKKSNERAATLRSTMTKSMQRLEEAREKLKEAGSMVKKAESDRARWEKKRTAMGHHLTEVRKMKIELETVVKESHLIRQNKISDVQAWLDYSKSPKMFARKKDQLLTKLGEISKTLTLLG